MLSSEDAFSYAIARTELVLMKANIDRELRPKRIGIAWVP